MENSELQGRIKNNFFWLVLNQGIFQALSFLGTLYLARVLGATSFGHYSFALALGQYLLMVGDFGISTYGVRQIAANKTDLRHFYPQLLTLKAVASVCCFIIFFLVFIMLDTGQNGDDAILLWSGFIVLTNALNSEWFFKGIERMGFVAAGNSIISISFFLFLFLAVSGNNDVGTAMMIRSCSYIPGVLFMLYISRKQFADIKPPLFIKIPILMVRESFVYMLTGGISMLYVYSFILILGFFYQDTSLGLFSAAYRLVLMIIVFATVLPMAFFPILADSHTQDCEQFKSYHSLYLRVLLMVCVPVTMACLLFSDEIIQFLYGGGYSASSGIFRTLSCALPLIFLRFAYGESMLSCGYQKVHLRANATGCLLACLITVFCTYTWGAQGAAAAFLLDEIVIFSLMFLGFSRNICVNLPEVEDCIKIGLVGLGMAACILMTDFHFIVQLIIGTGAYVAGLWGMGLLKI